MQQICKNIIKMLQNMHNVKDKMELIVEIFIFVIKYLVRFCSSIT